MKKLLTTASLVVATLTLAACGNSAAKAVSSSSNSKASSKVVHHKHHTKVKESSSSRSLATANQATKQQQGATITSKQGNSQPRQLTQGEINRQRGYDPTGAPLLPGQDHAAGANPDGTPDAWVQGQIDWARRNGMTNPDGSETQNFKNWVSDRNNAWDAGNDHFPDYDQNQQW